MVNWDKFAKEVDEEEENVEGDAAVNRMFQVGYAFYYSYELFTKFYLFSYLCMLAYIFESSK